MNLPIHPETKVGALLDAHPSLEAVLISIAPAFEKLRNPILRKTVAKVATLEQAARIGGIPVRDLVRQLRQAIGQPQLPDSDPVPSGKSVQEAEPAWVSHGTVTSDIDGEALLAEGHHPLGRVREQVARLSAGHLVRLSTSFRPEPLIDLLRQSGIETYSIGTAGAYVTYFRRPTP